MQGAVVFVDADEVPTGEFDYDVLNKGVPFVFVCES